MSAEAKLSPPPTRSFISMFSYFLETKKPSRVIMQPCQLFSSAVLTSRREVPTTLMWGYFAMTFSATFL